MKMREKTLTVCGGISAPNNDTELVFIIDKSGSMSGFESDTVGGFNATIEAQRGDDGDVYVSAVLFNNNSEVVYDRVNIEDIEPMTRADYRVGGSTALLDAIGDAIRHIRNVHKYARPEDVPSHTVFVITTDGMENASRKYSSDEVKTMIKKQTEDHGWEFMFLAANIDSVETARNIGIRPERAANYAQTSDGISECYRMASDALSFVRKKSKHVDFDLESLRDKDNN